LFGKQNRPSGQNVGKKNLPLGLLQATPFLVGQPGVEGGQVINDNLHSQPVIPHQIVDWITPADSANSQAHGAFTQVAIMHPILHAMQTQTGNISSALCVLVSL
jgi:hypothetical protein